MHSLNHHQHIKYFEGKMSRGFVALFTSKAITDVAGGMFAVFLPIFLYEIFNNSVAGVATFYLITYLVHFFFILTLAPYLNKFGFRRALRFSTFVAVLYYISLFFLSENNLYWILPFTVVFISLWRFLYWTPFNIDLSKFTSKKDRGKSLSLMEAVFNLTKIITPIFAGFIISRFNFSVLFIIGIVVFALSALPLIMLPRTKETFSWSRRKIFEKTFSKENRAAAALFFADGAESVVGVIVWPIFIFQLFKGNYLEVGAISTFVVAATIIMELIAGKYIDKGKKKDRIMQYGGFFYAIGWILKIFVITALHVFVIDAFHKFTQVFYRVPLDTFICEKAKDQKHLIDEFNVFRQMTITLGRIFMGATILIFSLFISLNWLFLFGALFSVFLSLAHTKLKTFLE